MHEAVGWANAGLPLLPLGAAMDGTRWTRTGETGVYQPEILRAFLTNSSTARSTSGAAQGAPRVKRKEMPLRKLRNVEQFEVARPCIAACSSRTTFTRREGTL